MADQRPTGRRLQLSLIGLSLALLVYAVWQQQPASAPTASADRPHGERMGATNPETDDEHAPAGAALHIPAAPNAAPAADVANAERAPIEVSAPALPDPDLPLGERFETLFDAAEAGDSRATCRLLSDMMRCRYEAEASEFTARVRRMQPAEGVSESTLLQASMNPLNGAAVAAGGQCAGIGADHWQRTEQASDRWVARLSVRQRVILAMLDHEGQLRRLNHPRTQFGQWSLYVYPQFLADHAIDFLQQGVQARDPLALEGMALLHAPTLQTQPPGLGPALPNPIAFLRYALLWQRLSTERPIESLQGSLLQAYHALSVQQQAEVNTWVAQAYQDWTSTPRRSQSGLIERPRCEDG